MDILLVGVFLVGLGLRLFSVFVSKLHEAVLRQEGATEFGALNTRLLAIAHTLFYLSCLAEAFLSGSRFDVLSATALLIYAVSLLMLAWIVRLLGPLWTVKIMIARTHPINRHWLFRTIRHPNYFLNILPELVAFALIFHAFFTLAIGLPVYMVILAIRIRQEEEAMQALFAGQS